MAAVNRRHVLGLLAGAPLAARTYFDMGAAWQKHESGLWLSFDKSKHRLKVSNAHAFNVGDIILVGGEVFTVTNVETSSGR